MEKKYVVESGDGPYRIDIVDSDLFASFWDNGGLSLINKFARVPDEINEEPNYAVDRLYLDRRHLVEFLFQAERIPGYDAKEIPGLDKDLPDYDMSAAKGRSRYPFNIDGKIELL